MVSGDPGEWDNLEFPDAKGKAELRRCATQATCIFNGHSNDAPKSSTKVPAVPNFPESKDQRFRVVSGAAMCDILVGLKPVSHPDELREQRVSAAMRTTAELAEWLGRYGLG